VVFESAEISVMGMGMGLAPMAVLPERQRFVEGPATSEGGSPSHDVGG